MSVSTLLTRPKNSGRKQMGVGRLQVGGINCVQNTYLRYLTYMVPYLTTYPHKSPTYPLPIWMSPYRCDSCNFLSLFPKGGGKEASHPQNAAAGSANVDPPSSKHPTRLTLYMLIPIYIGLYLTYLILHSCLLAANASPMPA